MVMAKTVPSWCWLCRISCRITTVIRWQIIRRECSVSLDRSVDDRIGLYFVLRSICFKLGVMLLAIEVERSDKAGNNRIVVDVVPCDNCEVLPGSRAFLMCMSNEDANRFVLLSMLTPLIHLHFDFSVKRYCSICYPDLDDLTEHQLKHMKKCSHGSCCIALRARFSLAMLDLVEQSKGSLIDQMPQTRDHTHEIMYVQWCWWLCVD